MGISATKVLFPFPLSLQIPLLCHAHLVETSRESKGFFFAAHSVISNSLGHHGLQLTRLPCASLCPRACSNSHQLSLWCHPTISSSVVPFSSSPQTFPASETFSMSQLFSSVSQSIGVSASASVLQMDIQDWSPLGLTVWISLLSKGLSRVFSNTTVQNHQFFSAQLLI